MPSLFALLPDKTEAIYCRFFNVIRQLRPNSRPSSCLVDFEELQNSIVATFPEEKIAGCLFYLGQSLWSKISEIGERIKYNNDENFQLKTKCFAALAFLAIDDVCDAFEEMTEDDDIPVEFIIYFEATYIGVLRGRGARRRRDAPLFLIELWNMRDRVLNNLPKSNNSVERFHNALRSSVTSMHPHIWKLCAALKKEEGISQTKIAHLRRGDRPSRKKLTK